jgi:hypothetical protein
MASAHERFWTHASFAFVGHSAKKGFPPGWVRRAAEAGIRDVWIHQARETPEALEVAASHRLNVLTGRCAMMYLAPTLSYHAIHRLLTRLAGKY